MIHDIPAKSRLVPVIPITSPQFVYRQARETDVRATFARVRAGLESAEGRQTLVATLRFRPERAGG